jgi:hypothetical protein
MFRALAVKELREIRGIVLLALAAFIYLVAAFEDPRLPPGFRQFVPFVQDSFLVCFLFVSAALAIALGLRQTLGESIPGTYPFLFHRPASRRWLVGAKLFLGMSAYLICAVIPILAYGLWAATPGTHASPFEWSMTLPAWELWFGMTLLYLGAFLTGIRPGRWYRSRILPLAAAAFAVSFVMAAFVFTLGAYLWACLIVLAIDVWLIAMILFVTRTRDYP